MKYLLQIVLPFLLVALCSCQTCEPVKGYEGCACQMSDTNEIIGLDALVTNDTQKRAQRFVVSGRAKWKYAYHPCRDFDMFTHLVNPNPSDKPCKGNTAVRFTDQSTSVCNGLGSTNTGVFSHVKAPHLLPLFNGTSITYRDSNSIGKLGAVMYLVCNETMTLDESIFSYLNVSEGVMETYYFSLESPCCCPGRCPVIPVPNKSSNTVWYIVGACVAVLLIVIIAFIAFRYYRIASHNREREQLLPKA